VIFEFTSLPPISQDLQACHQLNVTQPLGRLKQSPAGRLGFRVARIQTGDSHLGVTVSTAEVVSTTVLFMTVDAETVKLPGQAPLGISTGNEKFWEVLGGNANGGVWSITDSAFPQLRG